MDAKDSYKKKLIELESFLDMIKPGSTIFVSSEPSSPLMVIEGLMNTGRVNIMDLELIQLMTTGSFINPYERENLHFKLKTFHVGENFSRDITYGTFDYIPAPVQDINKIFERNLLSIDIAVVTLSKPNEDGYMSPGLSVDVSAIAARKAGMVVAEVNENMPFTRTEPLIHIDDVDYIIESSKAIMERNIAPYDSTIDRIAWNISNIIQDNYTIVMHVGAVFDALAKHLKKKKNIGILTSVISDWVIDLVEEGVIPTDQSYDDACSITTHSAYGTRKLYDYVHNNNKISFMTLEDVINFARKRSVTNLVSILNVQRIDITCNNLQFFRRDNILSGFPSKFFFAMQASDADHGRVICALRSVDQNGNSNIVITFDKGYERIRFSMGIIRYIVTEYGVAALLGKSTRERVMAIIDIAHPDHREMLLEQAKDEGYVYSDQIYITRHAVNYPSEYETVKTFKNDIEIKFRPIKPSDEDMLRRMFYKFSDNSRYLRYFSAIRVMPHKNMQKYANIDYDRTVSIVGIYHEGGIDLVVAEGRYSYYEQENKYEMGFAVDEDFQGMGIATFLLNYLIRIARERGIGQLYASVLPQNKPMLDVFQKGDVKPVMREVGGYYDLTFNLKA